MSELNTEVVLQFISSNQEAKEAILNNLKENDKLSFFKEEELKKWTANLEEDSFKKTTSEFASRIEDTIQKISGIDKEQNEKWHTYAERVFGLVNNEKEELLNKYEELKSTRDVNKEYEDRNKALESMLSEEKEKRQLDVAKVLREKQDFQKRMLIQQSYDKLKIKDLGEYKEIFEPFKSAQFDKLLSQSKIEGDKLVFVDENGDTLINRDNLAEPFTADEMVKAKFEPYIDNGVQFKGTGEKESRIKSPEKSSDGVTYVLAKAPKNEGQALMMLKNYYKENNLGGQSSPKFLEDFNILSAKFNK